MGIDFSPGRASWSYSGYGIFRQRLAWYAELGDLDKRVGFGGSLPFTENHPLLPLINHSDCDGHLSVDDCLRVAPALVDAVLHMETDLSDLNHQYDRRMGLRLAAGMLLAASENITLEFR